MAGSEKPSKRKPPKSRTYLSKETGASPTLMPQEEDSAVENNKTLKCHDCKKEILISLLNMDESTYDSINELANSGVRWHCPSCLSVPRDGVEATAEMDEFRRSVQQDIQAMASKFEAQLGRFQSSVSSMVDAACQRETTEVTKSLTSYASVMTKNLDKQTKTAEDVVALKENLMNLNLESDAEKRLIKLKSMNVCVHNVPESIKTDPTEAANDDIAKLKNILGPHITIKKEDVNQVWRAGEKNSTKTRPVVMKFTNSITRTDVLKLRKLTYSEGKVDGKVDGEVERETEGEVGETEGEVGETEAEAGEADCINIYISPDRTVRQRNIHRKLVDELRRRKGNGETNIFIKNGMIVKFSQPFRSQPQVNWG